MNEETEAGRLTPEQVKNWRNMLLGMIGPYALIMPVEDVQRFRDMMQARANALDGGPDIVAPLPHERVNR